MKQIMMVGMVLVSIAGCVSHNQLQTYEGSDATELTISRSDELQGSLSQVYIGCQ